MMTLAVLALLHAQPMAPAQVKPQNLPRFADLLAVIGADFRGDAFRPIGRVLGPEPTIRMYSWDSKSKPGLKGLEDFNYITWRSKGVQCRVVNNIIDTIWLENTFAYDSKYLPLAAYTGELPNGLTLDDDAATVIRKMGPPEEPFEAIGPVPASDIFPERTETSLGYPSRGLTVVTWKLPGASEVIFHVKIEKPRKPERR